MEQNQGRCEFYYIASGLVALYASRAPYKTSSNEDSAALIPLDAQSCVLVVADGAGGMSAGAQASGVAVQAIHVAISRSITQGLELREGILNGIETANREVMALGTGANTTLAVVEIQRDMVRPYHVGDSMIMVVGQKGKIKLQTIAHSPVGYAVEAGLLCEREALHHDERHIVSNMIGSSDMHIDIGPPVALTARDTLIIGSDGLFDNLHIDEIVERVRKTPLVNVCHNLAQDCEQRMRIADDLHPSKPDDLLFTLYRPSSKK